MKASRDAFGETLVKLGQERSEIVVLDADVGSSTRTEWFRDKFPERFFEMGISEQNMFGVAAGLAACGKIPFVSTFAVFGSARVADQLRNTIAYPELNIKVAVTHAGITVGEDGATHQSVEDIGIIRSIPNFTIIVPSDALEAEAVVRAAVDYNGPVYLRFTRGKTPFVHNEDNYSFNWGRVEELRDGEDLTIFATGIMVAQALKAADMLAEQKISAKVVNVHTIKPIDIEGVIESVRKTAAVVTAEEHNILGGLGSTIAEVLSENIPVPMKRVGIKDTFGESGTPDELMTKYGLMPKDIVQASINVLKNK